MAQIIITPRPFHQKGQRYISELEAHGHTVVVNNTGRRLSREKLHQELVCADAVITGNDPLDAELLGKATGLKVIAKYGVGLDNIDTAWCAAHHIAVRSALGANSQSVAEYTVLLILAALRRFYELTSFAKANNDARLIGCEAEGKTLGLIGVGAIGRRVAQIASALGMKVLGTDPALAPGTTDYGVLVVSQEELLSSSDIVSLHLPLTASTSMMVNQEFLSNMKTGAILVNTARGGIVDSEALFNALVSGRLAFAAEDVELKERPAHLVQLKQYLITPHAASFTTEADEKTMASCVSNVLDYLE